MTKKIKRIILFSKPTETNIKKISDLLFPAELKDKVLAYMPADGGNVKQIYLDYWKEVAEERKAEFALVNNSLPESAGESHKLQKANILLITGGNTFKLLHNLRQSKLDQAIRDFIKKNSFVLGGMSAGAIVLSPTIEICNLPPDYDVNEIGIKDLTGLGIVNFEVFPHYTESRRSALDAYRKKTGNRVRKITDEDIISLEL